MLPICPGRVLKKAPNSNHQKVQIFKSSSKSQLSVAEGPGKRQQSPSGEPRLPPPLAGLPCLRQQHLQEWAPGSTQEQQQAQGLLALHSAAEGDLCPQSPGPHSLVENVSQLDREKEAPGDVPLPQWHWHRWNKKHAGTRRPREKVLGNTLCPTGSASATLAALGAQESTSHPPQAAPSVMSRP